MIPLPALPLSALRRAVAAVAPSRLPEFSQEIQDAFTQSPPGSAPPNEPSPTPTPLSGTRPAGIVQAAYREVRVADWHGEAVTDDLLDRREFTGDPPGLALSGEAR